MATATKQRTPKIPTVAVSRTDKFKVVGSDTGLGYNAPQLMGRKMWLPMFAMAVMGWAIGMILGFVEAGTDRADAAALQNLGHLIPAFMFIGFLSVFASITFAIARILGAFRKGGGEVQEVSGAQVQTLKMPPTAKVMLGLMMMGMMVVMAGVIGHFIAAGSYDGSGADAIDNAQWAYVSTGLRRMGTAMYLTGIAFGLGTIIEVLRFQVTRIREVAAEHGHDHSQN